MGEGIGLFYEEYAAFCCVGEFIVAVVGFALNEAKLFPLNSFQTGGLRAPSLLRLRAWGCPRRTGARLDGSSKSFASFAML